MLAGDIGGWAIFEQQLYRVPKSDDRGIGIFARVSGALADRNLIDLTRGSNSSVSATNGRTTSLGSRPAMRTSRSEPRPMRDRVPILAAKLLQEDRSQEKAGYDKEI